MTDDTQPEAMDLADWLEAVGGGPSAKRCAALLREQHARIAELESELEAMDAGGVQALSAAPARPTVEQVEDEVSMGHGAWDMVDPQELIGAVLRLAASPTPPAEQQVIIDFVQVGTAGPFHAVNGRVKLPDATMQDLARMLRPTYEAEQAAPKAAPGVGNSGFDHQTAADFLSGKTVNDEAVRKFVQASRWAHDEKAALSAMLLSARGVLASREAEIALLKKALLEAEAAPQQEAQPNYVVSLVVVKEIPTGVNTQNKLYTVNAASADEAVGKAVLQMPSDFPEHRLHTACFVAAPAQPAPAPPSDDSALLDWIAIHGSFGVDSSTGKAGGNGQKCVAATRKNIRAAIAAQRGNK